LWSPPDTTLELTVLSLRQVQVVVVDGPESLIEGRTPHPSMSRQAPMTSSGAAYAIVSLPGRRRAR
jgi:hypothetical protein